MFDISMGLLAAGWAWPSRRVAFWGGGGPLGGRASSPPLAPRYLALVLHAVEEVMRSTCTHQHLNMMHPDIY